MSFFIVQDVITSKKKLNILITAIALSIGIVSFFAISDYVVAGNINKHGGVKRIGGIYENVNSLASFSMFGLPFICFLLFNARSFVLKLVFSILFFSVFFALGLTVSRTYLMSFTVFAVAYSLLGLRHRLINMKTFFIGLIIVSILIFFLSHFLIGNITERASQDVSEDLRYFIFLKGIRLLFIEHPIIGVGLNNFQHVSVADDNLNNILSTHGGMHGHDIVSKVFSGVGLVGSAVLLIIFYRIIKNLNNALKNYSLRRDKYLFNFVVAVQAGYISLLSSAIGNGLIFDSRLWTYYSLSVLMYKWGGLNDMEFTSNINSSGPTNMNNVAGRSSVLRG